MLPTLLDLPNLRFRKLSDKERAQLLLPPLPDAFRQQTERDEWEIRKGILSVPIHRAASCYSVLNCALPTTAAPVSQPTGTAIRTMLQLKVGAGASLRIIEWTASFDGSAAATPGKVELFETTVAATMSTAYVDADITRYNNGTGPAQGGTAILPIDTTSTSTSGFATAAVTEGTVANYRHFDAPLLPPTAPWSKQFPLGREPDIVAGHFLRCRVTFGATINMIIQIVFEA